jgi:hypothetical protein
MQDLGRAVWSVGSRGLRRPRAETDEDLVTESNLSLRVAAHVAAQMALCGLSVGVDGG